MTINACTQHRYGHMARVSRSFPKGDLDRRSDLQRKDMDQLSIQAVPQKIVSNGIQNLVIGFLPRVENLPARQMTKQFSQPNELKKNHILFTQVDHQKKIENRLSYSEKLLKRPFRTPNKTYSTGAQIFLTFVFVALLIGLAFFVSTGCGLLFLGVILLVTILAVIVH